MSGHRKPAMKTALHAAILLVLVPALVGCGRSISSDPNLETWVTTIKNKPVPPPPPVPVMQRFETFVYNDQGLRDPFAPPVDASKAKGQTGPDPDRRKQVLEAYPLDGLVMVGTLGAGDHLVGLVMSPDRVTHRVLSGTYMGQNDGRVTVVGPAKIDITELVPDGAGGWIERPASIALPNQ